MRKLNIAVLSALILLQHAASPVPIGTAATALAASAETVSTTKTNYSLTFNTNSKSALELHDTRATFDTAVLAPLRAAQDAKAKADAEAAAQKAAQAASVSVQAPMVIQPVGDVKQLAYALVCSKWGADQWVYVDNIVSRESGWNPYALNTSSGAGGLFQALPYSKVGVPMSDIAGQMNWGMGYIAGRYGTPANAWNFWLSHHWY